MKMQTGMRALKARLALIVGTVLVSSCAIAPPAGNGPHYWDTVLGDWKGREAIELWRTWGVPTAIVEAPNGNEMHVYIGNVTGTSSGALFFESNGLSVGKNTSRAGCETDFEVNDAKVIVGAIWRGDACPKSEKQQRPKWLAAVPIGF